VAFEHAIHSFLMIVQKSGKNQIYNSTPKKKLWQVFFTNKIGN
jgi:hypothetical protein